MAEADIVLTTLINAGLRLNAEDYAEVKRKLASLEVNTGDDFAGLRKQAEALGVVADRLKKQRDLLQRAATKGFDPETLTAGQRHQLRKAFEDVKVYRDGLVDVTKQLRTAGKGAGQPFINELRGMESVFKQLEAITRNVSPMIDRVTTSYKANAAAAAKKLRDENKLVRDQATQARTSETLKRASRIKATQSPEGRKAFLTAARGNAGDITTSAAAKQGRGYAASALTASEKAVQLERDRSGPDSPAVFRAERKQALAARTFADLDTRARELAVIEARDKKDAQEAKQAAAKAERQQVQAAKRRQTQATKLQNLATDARGAALKNPEGKKYFEMAQRGNVDGIANTRNAKLGLEFARKEYDTRLKIHKLTEDIFGADSKTAKQTLRELDGASQAVDRLRARQESLGAREKLSKKDAAKAEALARTEAEVAQARILRGRSDRAGRKALQRGGGVGLSTEGFTNLDEAKKALGFVKGEMNDLKRLQTAYAKAFGETSDQSRQAAAEALRHSSFYGKLKDRVDTLGATTKQQTKADSYQDVVRASEEQRRRNADKMANGKRLLDSANGDFSNFTDVRALRQAKNYASSELRELEKQQNSASKSLKVGSQEFLNAQADADRYAKTIGDVNQRLDDLASLPKKVRTPDTIRSSLFPKGREIYENAGRVDGGLESLDQESARKAQKYVAARLREQVEQARALTHAHGEGNQAARDAGDGARKLAADLDVLTGAAKPAQQGMNLLQSTLRSFLKYAVGYAALYGLAAAFMALAQSVVELQTEMLDIQAVTGSTDSQMARLGQTVLNVARNSKFSLIELTKAAKILAQAGVSVEEMNSALAATANFAAATGSNLEVASDLLSTTRSVFKNLSDDVIANQLAKAINISKLTAEDLKTILSLGAQTAESFGLTSEQFLAAVATLRNAGLKASTTATGLRQGMLEIFTPDDKLVQALQTRYRELGETMGAEAVKARFFQFTKARNPLVAALTELKRLGFNDEGQMVLSRAFDVRSTNAIKAMIGNLKELSENETRITFGRAAAEGARVTMDGLNASFTRLISTINGFTYSRSEGILGFLTEVIQSLDQEIQRMERLTDLRNAARGLTPEERKQAGIKAEPRTLLQQSVDAVVDFGQLFNPFTYGKRFQGKEADLRDNIRGDDGIISRAQLSQEENNKEAIGFNVKAARNGEAPGTLASRIADASAAADNLNAMVSNTFGPEMLLTDKALTDILDSYTSLTETQRRVRRTALEQQFPDMPKKDLDQMMFAMESAREDVSGAITGISKELVNRLVLANKQVREMGDRAPKTPEEFTSKAIQELYKSDQQVQEIVNRSSKLTASAQLQVLEWFGQTLNERILNNPEVEAAETVARKQVGQLAAKAKLLAETNDTNSGLVEFRAEVSNLLLAKDKSNEAALTYFKTLRDLMTEAAKGMGSGASTLFGQGIGDVDRQVKATQEKLKKESDDRVKSNQEVLTVGLADPHFRKEIESRPVGDPNKATLLSLIGKSLPDEEAQGNSQTFQMVKGEIETFNESTLERANLKERVKNETSYKLGLANEAGRAADKFADAQQRNQFGAARQAKGEETAARVALLNEEIKKAESDLELNFKRNSPEQNFQIEQKRVELENERNRLQEKHVKEVAKLDQEENLLNNKREENRLRLEQKRAKTVLDTATDATPQASIDEAVKQIDATNKGLLATLNARDKLKGDQSDLSDAEMEERQRFLKPFRETADYLEGVLKREDQAHANREILIQTPLTTGNNQFDATADAAGVAPGTRTQRKSYLVNKAELLQTQLSTSGAEMSANDLAIADLEAQQARDTAEKKPVDQDVAKKLDMLREKQRSLTVATQEWNKELGVTQLEISRVAGTWQSGMDRAFDPKLIQLKLEQSQNSLEHFGEVINDEVVDAVDGLGDALADVALEGKSAADALGDVFADLGKNVVRTLIKTLSNEVVNSMIGLGKDLLKGTNSGGGSGLGGGLMGIFSSVASLFGGGGGSATYKGAQGFAGGGVIRGPGTGTSDSIPAYVQGANGRRKPLMLSDGESILTAKATAALGEDFVQGVNSGRLLRARTGAVLADQAALSVSAVNPADTTRARAPRGPSGPGSTQVNVTPAQMRMRMGDWLEQHVIEELSKR
jgi:TP901 family phage tail tape measure protein